MGLVALGILHPPQPVQIFPISDVEKAFPHMQTGRSKGKLVLTVDREDQVNVSFCGSKTRGNQLILSKTLPDTKASFHLPVMHPL